MGSQESAASPSPSSHRLPTVSASQAFQKLKSRGARSVSTGLAQLNKVLSPPGLPGSNNTHGGLVRGKTTEVYGPSGVGKTAFGIQAAVNALREGQHVVWVDAAAPLVTQRFNNVLFACLSSEAPGPAATASPPSLSPDELQSHFHHYTAPTLAHLLALFVRPPSSFPPPNTSLIVIDSLSTLFDNAYPRNADDRNARNRSDYTRWAAGRKLVVMNDLVSKLTRVAVLHDIALLLTCQTITRIRGGARALLVPSISGAEWDAGVSTRLVLFRDWVPGQGKWNNTDAEKIKRARFVGVVRANGITFSEETGVGTVVPFTIERSGICDLNIAATDIAAPTLDPSPSRPPKRRFTEIADSEDDLDSDGLYGWVEDDEVAAEGLVDDEDPLVEDTRTAVAAEPRTADATRRELPCNPTRSIAAPIFDP